MLTRYVLAGAALLVTSAPVAAADPTEPPKPPPKPPVSADGPRFIIEVETPGTPGHGNPPGGNTVPAGTNSAPAPVDPRDPDDTQCPGASTVFNTELCSGTADFGGGGGGGAAAPPPTPAELGARASAQIPLDAPTVHLTPGPGKTGLVGLPTWLWVDATPATWGPATATAAVPGLSVTATAIVDRITWTMGDGAVVTCTTPGTPYTPAQGARPSPDCGHTYARPGIHTVTATTHWTLTWIGGGQTGTLAATRTTVVPDIRTGEMQALTS